MLKPPTPPGGFGNQGNDFTVLRNRSGRIVHCNDADDGMPVVTVDMTQNAIDPMNIFGEDS